MLRLAAPLLLLLLLLLLVLLCAAAAAAEKEKEEEDTDTESVLRVDGVPVLHPQVALEGLRQGAAAQEAFEAPLVWDGLEEEYRALEEDGRVLEPSLREAHRRVDAYFEGAHRPSHLQASLWQQAVRRLRVWTRFESLAEQEEALQRRIQAELAWVSVQAEVYHPDRVNLQHHEDFVSIRKDFRGSPVLIGRLPGRRPSQAKSVLLNGHVDVVPVGNEKEWSVDPFDGTMKDGRMYGRGTTDMKGGVVSSYMALKALWDSGISLKGDVIFSTVVEEERGGAGTLSTVIEKKLKADIAIIPEPTSMKIFPKQQGSAWFRITVPGKGAHGGTRYDGVNAIHKAYKVLTALEELETSRNLIFKEDPLYKNTPIPVPINVGHMEGGVWPSSVPDKAIIEGRLGVGPGETVQAAKDALERAILEVQDDWLQAHPPTVEWWGARWPPGDMAGGNDELLDILKAAYRNVTSEEPVVEASPWATDAGILSKHGTPAVVFGPGTTELAHQADESVSIADIIRCAHIITKAILEYAEVEDMTAYPLHTPQSA